MEQQSHEPSPSNVRKKQRDAVADLTETPHDSDLESQGENNTERGRGEDFESNQVLCMVKKQKPYEECESITMEVDETDQEPKNAAEKTESLPSSQASVYPDAKISACSKGIVAQYTISGSNIGRLNINITSGKESPPSPQAPVYPNESIVPSKEESVDAAAPLVKNETIEECQRWLKENLKGKYENFKTRECKMPLFEIYTEPCITEGGNCEVKIEHKEIKIASTIEENQEKCIYCNHNFIPPPGQNSKIRTVITRGGAGIGKTACANKFILDWAEGRENTHLHFVFPLPFRDLNLVRNEPISLLGLINKFFPQIKDRGIFTDGQYKMLFILDGLDKSQRALDLENDEYESDVTQPSTIAVLLTNIIRGDLLPSALIWILSRPVVSSRNLGNYIDRETEVQGFSNPRKDEYFRKRIRDQSLADRAITQVKSCPILNTMCQIPLFCWVVASFTEERSAKKMTLTPMYILFLNMCEDSEANPDSVRNDLISLGKFAFEELEKGKSIFSESSLTQNGFKVTGPNFFSGMFARIIRNNTSGYQELQFRFMHPSVQDYLAALYVYLKFNNDNVNVLTKKSRPFLSRDSSELTLYKAAVKKALQCESGRFDMFLRFLLGLSLESNQTLVGYLMTHNRTNQKTRAEIIKYIKKKIQADPHSDRCNNLYYCLHELNDDSEMIELLQRS